MSPIKQTNKNCFDRIQVQRASDLILTISACALVIIGFLAAFQVGVLPKAYPYLWHCGAGALFIVELALIGYRHRKFRTQETGVPLDPPNPPSETEREEELEVSLKPLPKVLPAQLRTPLSRSSSLETLPLEALYHIFFLAPHSLLSLHKVCKRFSTLITCQQKLAATAFYHSLIRFPRVPDVIEGGQIEILKIEKGFQFRFSPLIEASFGTFLKAAHPSLVPLFGFLRKKEMGEVQKALIALEEPIEKQLGYLLLIGNKELSEDVNTLKSLIQENIEHPMIRQVAFLRLKQILFLKNQDLASINSQLEEIGFQVINLSESRLIPFLDAWSRQVLYNPEFLGELTAPEIGAKIESEYLSLFRTKSNGRSVLSQSEQGLCLYRLKQAYFPFFATRSASNFSKTRS